MPTLSAMHSGQAVACPAPSRTCSAESSHGTPVLLLDAVEVLPCAGAASVQGRGCGPTPLPRGQQGKSCSQQQSYQQPPALGSQPCSGTMGHGDSGVGGVILPFPNEGTDGVGAGHYLGSEGELQPNMGRAANGLVEKTHPSSGVPLLRGNTKQSSLSAQLTPSSAALGMMPPPPTPPPQGAGSQPRTVGPNPTLQPSRALHGHPVPCSALAAEQQAVCVTSQTSMVDGSNYRAAHS